MNDEIIIQGKIVGSDLGRFAPTGKLYGFTTIRKEDGNSIKVKIESHTECESIAVGDTVEIRAKELADTGIIVADRVRLFPGPFYMTKKESDAEATI